VQMNDNSGKTASMISPNYRDFSGQGIWRVHLNERPFYEQRSTGNTHIAENGIYRIKHNLGIRSIWEVSGVPVLQP
jgi:hypothetical protein